MDIWQNILDIIKKKTDDQTFDTWFKPVKLVSFTGDTLEIEVPNSFFMDWFSVHYKTLIQEALFDLKKREYTLKFICLGQNGEPYTATDAVPGPQESPPVTNSSVGDPLNPNYSFEKFVVGNSNQFAHAASLAVANNPAISYNPLFIYGGVGLGKTHLLNAIGNHIKNMCTKICYISSENFMNELINSIRYDKMPRFRERFRRVDILLIDDIQFIAGKERTQEEFFHTFNSLYQYQKQIVLTSDKFPEEIPSLEERLRSRFQCGLIADIQPPETETKIAILKSKASSNNILLPDDVALYLASHMKSNVRELEGLLIRVTAFASLAETELNLEIAQKVLKDIFVSKCKDITIENIQKAVADLFKVKVSELNSARKLKEIILPRQIAMYLSRKLTKFSFPEIGATFGGKDHSTVIYAVNKIEKLIDSDNSVKDAVKSVKKNLGID